VLAAYPLLARTTTSLGRLASLRRAQVRLCAQCPRAPSQRLHALRWYMHLTTGWTAQDGWSLRWENDRLTVAEADQFRKLHKDFTALPNNKKQWLLACGPFPAADHHMPRDPSAASTIAVWGHPMPEVSGVHSMGV
jgi:hypothetical protein